MSNIAFRFSWHIDIIIRTNIMKQILKNKSIAIALVILFSFTQNIGATFEKRENKQQNATESWLVDKSQKRISTPDATPDPDKETGGAPLSDSLPLLLGLGLAYGAYVFGRKSRRRIKN